MRLLIDHPWVDIGLGLAGMSGEGFNVGTSSCAAAAL